MSQVRQWLAGARSGEDAELLRRFREDRDETAFAALLDRHGPMVLGLCRRLVGDAHLAEDIFQATFLTLSRKAASVRRPESLAAWLHGVAFRLALKARKARGQSGAQSLSDTPAEAPDPLQDLSARELLAIIDAELDRLPPTFRLPLIHCCLEGRSLEEAARLLGWTTGSVKGRLERGRAKLKSRLARRGMALPAVLGPTLFLTQSTALAAPLVQGTLALAAGAAPSAAVASLAAAAAGIITAGKLKVLGAAVLAVGVVGAGFEFAAGPRRVGDEAGGRGVTASRPGDPGPAEPCGALPAKAAEDPLPPGAVARLGTSRHRHLLARVVMFHPSGKAVFTVGEDGRMLAWDPATGDLLQELALPDPSAGRGSISADGRVFLRRTTAGAVEVSAPGAAPSMTQTVEGGVATAVLSADGSGVATLEAGPNGTHLIRVYSGRPLRPRPFGVSKSYPGDLTISPDGARVYANAAADTVIRCWDGARDGPAWEVKFRASRLILSADGRWLLAVPEEPRQSYRLFDALNGAPADVPPLPKASGHLTAAVSSGGDVIAFASDQGIQLWDVRRGRVMHQFPGEAGDVAFSPDGRTLAAVCGAIRCFDVASGRPTFPSAAEVGHTAPVAGIAWSADGRRIVSHTAGAADVVVWDLSRREPKRLTEGFRVPGQIVFDAGGRGLVVLSDSSRIGVVADAATGKETAQFQVIADGDPRNHEAAADAAGKKVIFLIRGDDDAPASEVIVVEPQGGRAKRVFRVPAGMGRKLFLSQFGSAVLNRRGEQFDPLRGTSPPRLALPEGRELIDTAACSADGLLLAAPLSDGRGDRGSQRRRVGVWERATGALLGTFPATDANGPIALSPDGRTLAVGGRDRVVLYDVLTGDERPALRTPGRSDAYHATEPAPDAMAFAPDGRTLATGHADTTILLWPVPPPSEAGISDAERAWADLAAGDASGVRAMLWLADRPDKAMPLLREKLREAGDDDRLRRTRAASVLARIATPEATRLAEETAKSDELRFPLSMRLAACEWSDELCWLAPARLQ